MRQLASGAAVALLVGGVAYIGVSWMTGAETRESVADDGRPTAPTGVVPEGLTPGPTPSLVFPTDWNYEVHDALATDAAKQLFDGDLAGIHVDGNRDHARPEGDNCPEPAQYVRDMTVAAGTPYDILSSGLPVGVRDFERPSVAVCQGEVMASGRTLLVDEQYVVNVIRLFRPQAWTSSYGPEERTYEAELAGRPVVVVAPVLESGVGQPVVIAADPVEGGFVMTWIGHNDIPLERLLSLAEEILK